MYSFPKIEKYCRTVTIVLTKSSTNSERSTLSTQKSDDKKRENKLSHSTTTSFPINFKKNWNVRGNTLRMNPTLKFFKKKLKSKLR